jgi:hypothetical protein
MFAERPDRDISRANDVKEKRQWMRRLCAPDVQCHIAVSSEVRFSALKVRNVSPAGLTLVIDRILTIGTTVTIELSRPERKFSCQRAMRIIYLFKDPAGDFVLGGAFPSHLRSDDIAALV